MRNEFKNIGKTILLAVGMGLLAQTGIAEPKNISLIGETSLSEIMIEQPRIPYYQNQVLAYKEDYNYLISKYNWDIATMSFILQCESSGNPKAPNEKDKHKTCNGSYGLMQLSCEHLTDYDIWDSWQDPAVNIDIAYKVWVRQGYGAWRNCYKSYLKSL